MTLGRTAAGAIKIKTDDGLRAVECDCCNPPPCGGCGGWLSASTQDPKPTSLAWSASFGGEASWFCFIPTVLEGTITGEDCSVTAAYCISVQNPEDAEVILDVRAELSIGRFKITTASDLGFCGEYSYDYLEVDPEAECALWFSVGFNHLYDPVPLSGLSPYPVGTGGIVGPFPLSSVIGTHSHSATFTIKRPEVAITEDGGNAYYCIYEDYTVEVSATITIS